MAKKGKKRLVCDFKEFEDYAEKLDKLAGSNGLKKAVSKSLQKSYDLVTKNEEEDINKHTSEKTTGRTKKSLLDNESVQWEGISTAYINVGYDLSISLASIFLMYGTPRHKVNHPGTKKDTKMYNDIYGSKTKKEIQKIQKETFEAYLKKYMGG